MTTLSSIPAVAQPAVSLPRRRASFTIGIHTIVDFFSFVTIALMPLLKVRLDLTSQQVALLLGAGSVASGLIQPIVAWIGDRMDTRVLATVGVVVATLAIGCVGLAQSYTQLVVLFVVGAAGVGAYHPASAAAVGQLAGPSRRMFLTWFFIAGMTGGVAGNVLVPRYVNSVAQAAGTPDLPDVGFGLLALTWLIPVGLIAAGVLAWAIHRVPHRAHDAHERHAELDESERRLRWFAVGLLYITNVIRFSVNVALIFLVLEWLELLVMAEAGVTAMTEELGLRSSKLNGPMQGAMQVGMASGALVLGIGFMHRWLRPAFVLLPLLGAAAVMVIPMLLPDNGEPPIAGAYQLCIVAVVLTGVGFGALIPSSMSLAQHLLPHRAALASGMMLGGAWCFAFTGPWIAERVMTSFGLIPAFGVTAGALAIAGLLAAALPKFCFDDA